MRDLTYGEIYLISFPNGKGYVGQTTLGLESRIASHRHTAPQRTCAVTLAIRKHGISSAEVLESVVCSRQNLDSKEARWIETLGTSDRDLGYNIASGGNTSPMSEGTRDKLALASASRKHTAETREKMRASRALRQNTEEEKQRLRELRIGVPHTDETRSKMSESRRGHPVSAETKAKMSASAKGHTLSTEAREKIGAALRGRKKSPEEVELMRQRAIAAHNRKRG